MHCTSSIIAYQQQTSGVRSLVVLASSAHQRVCRQYIDRMHPRAHDKASADARSSRIAWAHLGSNFAFQGHTHTSMRRFVHLCRLQLGSLANRPNRPRISYLNSGWVWVRTVQIPVSLSSNPGALHQPILHPAVYVRHSGKTASESTLLPECARVYIASIGGRSRAPLHACASSSHTASAS